MTTDPGNAGVRLALGLAFVGGYCDAASIILVRTFTGHVTGNFVLLAVKGAAFDWRGALAALLSISCFLSGTFLSVFIAGKLSSYSARFILCGCLALEVACMVAAYFALLKTPPLAAEMYVAGLSLALGLQNGALRRANGISVHTTFLTGMITTLIVGHVGAESRSGRSPGWRILGGIWLFFVGGALTGSALVFRFKETGILGAAVVLILILIMVGTSRLERQPVRAAETKE
jgi:uncharacterized membrane protein YoaK (UPF0700 family)